jgi:hypothetical protein
MNRTSISALFITIFLIYRLLKSYRCRHEEQTYYDAAGNKLPGDQTDPAFTDAKRVVRHS